MLLWCSQGQISIEVTMTLFIELYVVSLSGVTSYVLELFSFLLNVVKLLEKSFTCFTICYYDNILNSNPVMHCLESCAGK